MLQREIARELWIGGAFQASEGGGKIGVENPASGEQIGSVPRGTPADIGRAVESAEKALRESDWADNPRRRATALKKLARAISERHEEIARLITQEQGKPLREARGEVAGAIDSLEFYSGLCRALYGRATQTVPEVYSVVLRQPVGIVGVITPWNWPLTLLMRSLAPALATGNAAIVKPASDTPMNALEVAALTEAIPEFPPGILNVVTGSGSEVGSALVDHPKVEMIAFTGDSETGKAIMRRAAEGLKKVSLELGGKSPNIVFADANLEKAVPGAINAAFTSSGQICTAGSRLLLEESIAGEFLERLKASLGELKVGDGLDPTTDVGPLSSKAQLDRVLGYVKVGRAEGELVTGGERLGGDLSRGYFLSPAVFAGLPQASRLNQEEIFGPVLTVTTFRDEEEAISLANGTCFGLASGLWTQDVGRVMRVGSRLRAGTVWVNTYHQFYNEAEVGGVGQSGIGRHQGLQVLEEFQELKHINLDTRQRWVTSRGR